MSRTAVGERSFQGKDPDGVEHAEQDIRVVPGGAPEHIESCIEQFAIGQRIDDYPQLVLPSRKRLDQGGIRHRAQSRADVVQACHRRERVIDGR